MFLFSFDQDSWTSDTLNRECYRYKSCELRRQIWKFDVSKYGEKIKDGIYYTPELIKLFQERDSVDITVAHYKPQVITSENHKRLLYEIKKAFESSNTSYKIVISPMWDALHINPQDKKILQDIFGKEYIYDYSGYNSYTQDWQNYYERMHYRVGVANDIMNKIY